MVFRIGFCGQKMFCLMAEGSQLSFKKQRGRGGGLVLSILAFYSDELSSNRAVPKDKSKWKVGRVWAILKKFLKTI